VKHCQVQMLEGPPSEDSPPMLSFSVQGTIAAAVFGNLLLISCDC
jgi:hypothetical protein